MADPLQSRATIFGQLDEHTVGLPLLQSAEESLGGAGTMVANAEDFVHEGCGFGRGRYGKGWYAENVKF